ncbi:MAG: hypothetical protein R6V35_03305 [Candidatus Nanohaloarchaea archaeon]
MKLGKCLICGERVDTEEIYITATEGYAHTHCLKNSKHSSGMSA